MREKSGGWEDMGTVWAAHSQNWVKGTLILVQVWKKSTMMISLNARHSWGSRCGITTVGFKVFTYFCIYVHSTGSNSIWSQDYSLKLFEICQFYHYIPYVYELAKKKKKMENMRDPNEIKVKVIVHLKYNLHVTSWWYVLVCPCFMNFKLSMVNG